MKGPVRVIPLVRALLRCGLCHALMADSAPALRSRHWPSERARSPAASMSCLTRGGWRDSTHAGDPEAVHYRPGLVKKMHTQLDRGAQDHAERRDQSSPDPLASALLVHAPTATKRVRGSDCLPIGLRLRARSDQPETPSGPVIPRGAVFPDEGEAAGARSTAQTTEDYLAVGSRQGEQGGMAGARSEGRGGGKPRRPPGAARGAPQTRPPRRG